MHPWMMYTHTKYIKSACFYWDKQINFFKSCSLCLKLVVTFIWSSILFNCLTLLYAYMAAWLLEGIKHSSNSAVLIFIVKKNPLSMSEPLSIIPVSIAWRPINELSVLISHWLNSISPTVIQFQWTLSEITLCFCGALVFLFCVS